MRPLSIYLLPRADFPFAATLSRWIDRSFFAIRLSISASNFLTFPVTVVWGLMGSVYLIMKTSFV